MSTLGKRVIFAGPADGANHKPLNVEGLAVAATPPGSSLILTGAGFTLATDANGDFRSPFLVADKDQMRTKSVDDSWTIAENMVAIAPRSGEFLNVLVITAQACVVGLPVARSSTAGALKLAAVDGSDDIVGYCDETVTTTATQLVRVRVV